MQESRKGINLETRKARKCLQLKTTVRLAVEIVGGHDSKFLAGRALVPHQFGIQESQEEFPPEAGTHRHKRS